jgi:hypothetical protein
MAPARRAQTSNPAPNPRCPMPTEASVSPGAGVASASDDEQALREFAAQDPVVTTGTAAFELGRLAAGHVRGR